MHGKIKKNRFIRLLDKIYDNVTNMLVALFILDFIANNYALCIIQI